MKTKILIISIVLFAIGIGALLTYIPLREQNRALKEKVTREEKTSGVLKDTVRALQQDAGQAIMQTKTENLSQSKTGNVYYTYTLTPGLPNQTQVDIYIKGDANTAIDAADLVLTVPETIQIKEIRRGASFPSYPRLMQKDNALIMTGVAVPQAGGFAYGKTNEVFATIIIESGRTNVFTVDYNNTGVYLNGLPILDMTKSFREITL
ncbi:MAG: hypothetical protein WC489_04455 [Patescibacteria group bacterium]